MLRRSIVKAKQMQSKMQEDIRKRRKEFLFFFFLFGNYHHEKKKNKKNDIGKLQDYYMMQSTYWLVSSRLYSSQK